jgi:hypothetical protein
VSRFTLRRFDQMIYRAKSASDPSRVPAPYAPIEFYYQGATVSASATIGTSGTTTLSVYDPGRLRANDVVQVGVGGQTVTVSASPTATGVTVSNTTGAAITVQAGVRLILLSRRPTVFSDPFGAAPVAGTSSILADEDGRARAYIAERLFDMVVGSSVTLGAQSTATLDASQSSLSWTHQVGAVDELIVLAIAWQETMGEEQIQSVTIGGAAMTRLAASAWQEVWYRQGATVGSQTIQVSWARIDSGTPGTGAKGAVAGVISFKGGRAYAPLGEVVTASGTSNSASVSLPNAHRSSFVLSSAAVSPGGSTTSLTPTSPLTQRWNLSGGHAAAVNLVQGAGATMPVTIGTPTTSWALGASKPWGAIALEVVATADTTTLVIDELGGVLTGEDIVNAASYPTLQDAIDDCPSGGRVYAPAGTYQAPDGGFSINKPIELFGDGPRATILIPHADSGTAAQPVIKVSPVSGELGQVILHDFQINDPTTTDSTPRRGGNHGIHCEPLSTAVIGEVHLERIDVANMKDDGFHFEGQNLSTGAVVLVYGVRLTSILCRGSGFYIENATVTEFHNSYAAGNALFGAFALGAQVAWYSCAFENNCRFIGTALAKVGGTQDNAYSADWGAQLRMKLCSPARVESCDFEDFGDNATLTRFAKTAIIYEGCAGALVANSSFYNGHTSTTGKGIVVSSDPDPNGQPQGGWVTVLTNAFVSVETPVHLQNGVRATSVFPQRMSITQGVSGATSMEGVLGLAVLARPGSEVPSFPNLAAAGQLVFDTTAQRLKCWDGTQWRVLTWS